MEESVTIGILGTNNFYTWHSHYYKLRFSKWWWRSTSGYTSWEWIVVMPEKPWCEMVCTQLLVFEHWIWPISCQQKKVHPSPPVKCIGSLESSKVSGGKCQDVRGIIRDYIFLDDPWECLGSISIHILFADDHLFIATISVALHLGVGLYS